MPLIAVDIGNSRIKFGLFDAPISGRKLPWPRSTFRSPPSIGPKSELRKWLDPVPAESTWWLASVNRPGAKKMMEWLQRLPHRAIAAGDGRSAPAIALA